MVNYRQLARRLADDQFYQEYEALEDFHTLHEPDSEGRWVLREEYEMIYQAMLFEWENTILFFEKEKEAAIIHWN